MGFVTTTLGQQHFLNAAVYSEVLKLRLFANDRVPSKTDIITNYQEVIYLGYYPKLLTPSEWIIQLDELTGDYVAVFPQQIFTLDNFLEVYGYYITNNKGNKLLMAERFAEAPVRLQSYAGKIRVTPMIGWR